MSTCIQVLKDICFFPVGRFGGCLKTSEQECEKFEKEAQ